MGKSNVVMWWVALALWALAGCATPPVSVQPPAYWPTERWQNALPEEHGFAASLSESIAAHVQTLPFLDGLLIIRHGYVVHESYYNGYDAESIHDIASVTKSWTSALVGVARAEGKLSDLDATLPELLPERFATGNYEDKRTITLRHLLQMRSGLDFDEDTLNTGGYGGEELLEGDLTALALSFPVAHPPGESWKYSTLDTQLISAIVQEAVGLSLSDYAQATLFPALGIGRVEWWEDATGTTLGGQNLSMTLADMAKLGLLYLHNGLWEGEQIVPAEWVELSLTPQNERLFFPATGQNELIEWQGYHWWTWKGEWFYGYRSFQASGYAGQQVLVFPELEMIIATFSNLEGVTPPVEIEQRTALNELFLETIFPALTDVELKE
jgi:CubicO group peptidase (beta-lactamase class C family)